VTKLLTLIQYAIAVLIFFLISSLSVFSQQDGSLEIKGKVLDEKTGEVLPGASILLVNEKERSVTDADGNFSVRAKSLPTTLSVHYLAYKTSEIIVPEYSSAITVFLREDAELLGEVVVVGYGTQRRRELTGSVASVSKAVLEQPTISLDRMLGGAVSGVNVTQTSGQPGAGSAIRIRGGNSVYASNEPLYVIDGFIFFSERSATQAGVGGIDGSLNPLAAINPSDIESIEVLKDVSAKAIYGSRGANGVILVTTKKGKRGGNTVNYQYSTGVDKVAKKMDLMDASQWARVQKDYFYDLTFSDEQIANLGKGENWQDAVFQTGLTQTHELSISGGDEKTRYLLSGNYTDQQGIILRSGFERFSGRINLDREISAKLTVGITVTADKSTQNALTTFDSSQFAGSSDSNPFGNGIANSLTYALYIPPVIPVYNSDGSYNHSNKYERGYLNIYGHAANPVADLEDCIGQTVSTSLLGNFYAAYSIVDGLKVKINAGTNVSNITQNFFAPPHTSIGMQVDIDGTGSVGNRHTEVTQTEYLLTYTKQLNPEHFVDLLAGYTSQQTETGFLVSRADSLESFDNLAKGVKLLPPISRTQDGSLHSLIGRVNYTLLSRYNLTATFRADKSSRFSRGNEWGYFPSIGFSWNVSQEKFMESLYPTLTSLKFRSTYGTAGNQEIDFDEYDAYFNPERYGTALVSRMTNLGNENLKWETTTEYNAGIDAGFWNDRLTLVADVYYKDTRDLLLKTPPPLGAATTELQTVNIGNVTNKGFEFALNVHLIERKRLSWSIAANIARNVNTITSMGKYGELPQGTAQEQILRVGESVGSFYGYIFDGVVQSGDDVSKLPLVGGSVLQPGEAKYADISGLDGIPDKIISPNYDRTVIGSIQPDFTYGFSTSLKYRKFDLYIAFQGSQGNEVYNKLRSYLEGNPSSWYNMSSALLNAWTVDNPSNTIPRIADHKPMRELDSRFVEDASFLKMKNTTLSYTLPVKVAKQSVKLRAFVSVQNLFTVTKYKGYDPEVASGIDLGSYPSARSFLMGAGVTF
jgi:TonB-linked SusC/RagA family outer membrane protein